MALTSGLCPTPKETMLLPCLDMYENSALFAAGGCLPSLLTKAILTLSSKTWQEKADGNQLVMPLLVSLWNNMNIRCLVCFRLYLCPRVFQCQGNPAIVPSAEIRLKDAGRPSVLEVWPTNKGVHRKGMCSLPWSVPAQFIPWVATESAKGKKQSQPWISAWAITFLFWLFAPGRARSDEQHTSLSDENDGTCGQFAGPKRGHKATLQGAFPVPWVDMWKTGKSSNQKQARERLSFVFLPFSFYLEEFPTPKF